MPNAVKYWNGSSWQSPGYFGKLRVWNGSEWRMVEVKYAGASGSGAWDVPAGALDFQTVTVGAQEIVDYEFGYYDYTYGYYSGSIGSISDGTSNIYGGGAITQLYYNESGGSAAIYLTISGATNSGWTTMSIAGYTFSRTSASSFSGGQWVWSVATGNNPFGTSGTKTVLWT